MRSIIVQNALDNRKNRPFPLTHHAMFFIIDPLVNQLQSYPARLWLKSAQTRLPSPTAHPESSPPDFAFVFG